MEIYLAIITTVLVATQLIRLIQNAISLKRQEQAVSRQLAWLNKNYVTEEDFVNQRTAFCLLRMWLEKELDINYGAETEDYYEGSEDG